MKAGKGNRPAGNKGGARLDSPSQDARKVVSKTASCPEGHALPHLTKYGQCTPLYCAAIPEQDPGMVTPGGAEPDAEEGKVPLEGDKSPYAMTKRTRLARKKKKLQAEVEEAVEEADADLAAADADEDMDELLPGTGPGERQGRAAGKLAKFEALNGVGAALGRYAVRRKLLKVPKLEDEKQLETYVGKKLLELAPEALAQMEWDLKLGDDRARSEAAREILDRAGFGKGEKKDQLNAPIVIINPGAVMSQLPWVQRQISDAGQVVDVTPDKEKA
jgi:hypothetical protein